MIACVQIPPLPFFPMGGGHLYTGYLALARDSKKTIQEGEVAGDILNRETLHHI